MKNLFRLFLVLMLLMAAVSSSFALIVVDEKGKAVSGAKVYAVYSDPCAQKTEIEKSTTTDNKGQFSFSPPIRSSETTYRYFVAYKPGEYLGGIVDKASIDEGEFIYYPITNFEKIVIRKFKPLSGKITTKSGSPIGSVSVTVSQIGFNNSSSNSVGIDILKELGVKVSTTTNPNGRYLIKEIPDGSNVDITAKKSGYVARNFANAINNMKIVMYLGSAIKGKVVDEMGKSVSEAGIYLTGAGIYLEDIKTKNDGSFEIKSLKNGVYQIYATQKNYCSSKTQNITAKSGKISVCKNLVLRTGVELSGRVIEEETGTAVSGVFIFASIDNNNNQTYFDQSQSDSNGQYKIRVLPGKLSISSSTGISDIFPKKSSEEIIVGEKGLTNYDIVYWKGKSIKGIVVDEKKNPVKGVNIYGLKFDTRTTDNEGKFAFNYNPDDNYESIGLIAEDLVTGKKGVSDIDLKNTPDEIIVSIKPTFSISVLVKSKFGKPLPNAEVSIAKVKNPENYSMGSYSPFQNLKTDSKGVCLFKKLINGSSYTVTANKAGYYNDSESEPVSFKSKSHKIEIVLTTANRVQKGKVVDINNKPVPGADVKYISNSSRLNSITVKTDKNGNFTMKGLPDKHVILEVTKGSLNGDFVASKYTKNPIIQIVPSSLQYNIY